MIPFVLRARKPLPRESAPSPEIRFDEELQLWMNRATGHALVSEYAAGGREDGFASDFGETIMTRTREGVDQTEGAGVSDLGETIVTKTQEGIDTTERVAFLLSEEAASPTSHSLASSKFGETIITMTREGRDQGEGSRT
ncbi:MAG: hypothetical protein AAB011_05655 [Candidatus Eisenbacteria bacterium]